MQKEEFVLGIWNSGTLIPENLLINGRGRLSEAEFNNNKKYNKTGGWKKNPFKGSIGHYDKLPLSSFFVTPGKKYRFRIAYYSFAVCPVLVSIQQHDILIIASDSSPVRPKKVKSFIIHSGERCEYIVKPNTWIILYPINYYNARKNQ